MMIGVSHGVGPTRSAWRFGTVVPQRHASEEEKLPAGSDGRRRATVVDVAARAGVSAGTASKALNGRGQLRDETRRRVLQAARELSFAPAPPARRGGGARGFTIGLVTTDSTGRFSIPILLGAEEAFGAGQVSVLMCDTRGDAVREHHHVQTLASRRIDGIIVTGRRCDPRRPLADHLPVPVVYVMGPSADPADISVIPDNAGGARLGVAHLLASGRTRIAHVTGPQHHLAARVRADATTDAIRAADLELASGRVHYGAWTEEWGRQAAHVVLRAEPDCDAICCGNDQIARGAADSLRELGVRVPDDVALVGFDNWDVMATACRPPLTSVDMDLPGLGRYAATRLLDAIDGTPAPGVHELPCQLIVRGSTGVARAAGPTAASRAGGRDGQTGSPSVGSSPS
jgi:LacI family transcriptional regulator